MMVWIPAVAGMTREGRDEIQLIEIYYKGDKKKEDRKRIIRYYSKRT